MKAEELLSTIADNGLELVSNQATADGMPPSHCAQMHPLNGVYCSGGLTLKLQSELPEASVKPTLEMDAPKPADLKQSGASSFNFSSYT